MAKRPFTHSHSLQSSMKRDRSLERIVTLDAEKDSAVAVASSKKARTDQQPAPPGPCPYALDRPWWFVTTGEGGGSYFITEWTPQTAREPERVACALLDAFRSRDRGYFSTVLFWLTGSHPWDEEAPDTMPKEFTELGRAAAVVGLWSLPYSDCDIGGTIHEGPTLFYSSTWC